MNRVIWYKKLKAMLQQTVDLPSVRKILGVVVINDDIRVYAEVVEAAPLKSMRVLVVPTGSSFDSDGYQFLGTAVVPENLVFHVYIGREEQTA